MEKNRMQMENQEFDDPQFPGVSNQLEMEKKSEDLKKEMEFEYARKEDEIEKSLLESKEPTAKGIGGQKPADYSLHCRSIRIGLYKIHPVNNLLDLPVNLSLGAISFHAPVLDDSGKNILVCLQSQHINRVLVHFGKSLPVMCVFTTPAFGQDLRSALHMNTVEKCYFDPTSPSEKIQMITFLIDAITDEQCHFIRNCFLGDNKVREMDQKEVNEILVKSSPNKINTAHILKIQDAAAETSAPQILPTVIKTPQAPKKILKLFKYPEPPQTGGVVVTSEDFKCLNDREFLNDAIVDFYLKYISNEKLTESQRGSAHIFGSFFFTRLSQKLIRPAPGEEPIQNVPVFRHNLVKTWTKNINIFSKDFIIIPVNQNYHWLLAVICYPGKVPEVPESAPRSEVENNKSSDDGSSTVEQESSATCKEILTELCNDCKSLEQEISAGCEEITTELSNNCAKSNEKENIVTSINTPYLVEKPQTLDETTVEAPDITADPGEKQREEMPCICIFDSLTGPDRLSIPAILRQYLEIEWFTKNGTKKIFDENVMKKHFIKCPKQNNDSDCGLFLLQFVESFFENPIPFNENEMPDLTEWFPETVISTKRQQLKTLLLELQQKQSNLQGVNQL